MTRWIIAIVIILLSSGIAYWAVHTYRPAGALTIVESQSMDMSSMKPPLAPMPVATEVAKIEPFAATVSYSGRVVALGDQDITARVTGRVDKISVYPGQRVYPGQVLITLDSAELSARTGEAQAALLESQQQIGSREAEWRSRQREQQAVATSIPIARKDVEEAGQMTSAAEAKLVTVQAEFQRTQALQQVGGASLQELQQGQAQLAESKALYNSSLLRQQKASLAVSKAQAELRASRSRAEAAAKDIESTRASSQMREAQLRSTEVQLGYTQIVSTSSAEVVERAVSPGTLVVPGQVLLRLKETSRLRLQADVPADQAVALKAGLPITAKLLNVSIEAKITSVFRVADPLTKTMIVEALVEANPRLVPGAALTMEIALEKPEDQLTVSVAAIQQDAEGRSYVWKLVESQAKGAIAYTCVMHPEVVRPKPGVCPKCGMELVPQKKTGSTVVTRQVVQLGSPSGQRVAVLKGLQPGDELVIQGGEDLAEGMAAAKVQWGKDGPGPLPKPTVPAGQPSMAPMNHSGH